MAEEYTDRCARLQAALARRGRLAVAYSGGVDSSVLLCAATEVLGEDAVGVIADSPSLPRRELSDARRLATAMGARLVVLPTNELGVEGYRANAGDRCYWCRHTLFETLEAWARQEGFGALAYGEITDDLLDHRPGRRAAGEFGVASPLLEAGFTKEDVRRYARERGLPVADKPAQACLASRVPVGREVTTERLARIEEAEATVGELGFRVLRVRDHGGRARVEVGTLELEDARKLRSEVEERLAPLGFHAVELAAYGQAGKTVR